MAENVLSWSYCGGESDFVSAVLSWETFAGPGNGLSGVVTGLVDFNPDVTCAAGEGGAGSVAGW